MRNETVDYFAPRAQKRTRRAWVVAGLIVIGLMGGWFGRDWIRGIFHWSERRILFERCMRHELPQSFVVYDTTSGSARRPLSPNRTLITATPAQPQPPCTPIVYVPPLRQPLAQFAPTRTGVATGVIFMHERNRVETGSVLVLVEVEGMDPSGLIRLTMTTLAWRGCQPVVLWQSSQLAFDLRLPMLDEANPGDEIEIFAASPDATDGQYFYFDYVVESRRFRARGALQADGAIVLSIIK